MYERSAIVLERYIEKKFGFDKPSNLKENFENYSDLVKETAKYQEILDKEEKAIQEFDEVAGQIQTIQLAQEKLSTSNQKLEEERDTLFNDLEESPIILENKLKKIETTIDKNNEKLKNSRVEFMKQLCDFSFKRKERNKCEKAKRIAEKNYIEYVKKVNETFMKIDYTDVRKMKEFIKISKDEIKNKIKELMIKNGRNEKIKFNSKVIDEAVNTRIEIAEKEAEIYVIAYEKLQRILSEIENDSLNIRKYVKTLRDITVKKAFLEAEEGYIVGFLDNERITSINGTKIHNKMMEDACKNFKLDIEQINKLYDLILREISGKATKKIYNELYNKTYLKNIEEKEKYFEKEANNVNIKMGTVINSNYWRIEGIKNVYEVFQEEVEREFKKDLSAYKIEELEENEEEYNVDDNDDEYYDDDEEYYNDEYDEEDEYEYYDDEDIEEDDEIIHIKEDEAEEKKKNSKNKKDKKESKGIFNKIFREKKAKK